MKRKVLVEFCTHIYKYMKEKEKTNTKLVVQCGVVLGKSGVVTDRGLHNNIATLSPFSSHFSVHLELKFLWG